MSTTARLLVSLLIAGGASLSFSNERISRRSMKEIPAYHRETEIEPDPRHSLNNEETPHANPPSSTASTYVPRELFKKGSRRTGWSVRTFRHRGAVGQPEDPRYRRDFHEPDPISQQSHSSFEESSSEDDETSKIRPHVYGVSVSNIKIYQRSKAKSSDSSSGEDEAILYRAMNNIRQRPHRRRQDSMGWSIDSEQSE